MSHCENRKHLGEEVPPAAYRGYFLPCEHRRCKGTLFCIGHPLCLACGEMVRSRQGVWIKTGDRADIVRITSL